MKKVKCKSGVIGWQNRLQKNYDNFEDFNLNSEAYSLLERLGFKSAKDAWNSNPIIRGSVIPSDLEVVLDGNNKVEFIRYEIESTFKKFLEGRTTKEQLIKKLTSFDNKLKKLFGTKGDKSIWFRLFKGDTLVTTIDDIKRTLNNHYSNNNYKHFVECIEIGTGEIGMEVYFS